MKQYTGLISIGLATALFISCSKSEDPKLPVYLITKATADTYLTTFTYDGEKAVGVSRTSGGKTSAGSFVYNADGNIIGISYTDNTQEAFTYTNGNVTSRKTTDATNTLLYQWDYEYTGNQLTKVQYYEVSNGVAYPSIFRVYEYDNTSDDPVRVKEYNKYTPTYTYTYTYGQARDAYDAAKAPLKKYLRLLSTSIKKKCCENYKRHNYMGLHL